MCNMYNASARSVSTTCGYTANYGCGNYYNGWNGQYMCRDCNGNIWARNLTNCGCHQCSCCGCSCGCGNTQSNNGAATGNNGNSNTNGNGFTCVTFCGNTAATQTTATTDTTTGCYNRGCGYNRCGWNRSGCGCNWF